MPHELSEDREGGAPATRRERMLELGAVLLLSLTAVATAWSGYQAARWSGSGPSLKWARKRPSTNG